MFAYTIQSQGPISQVLSVEEVVSRGREETQYLTFEYVKW